MRRDASPEARPAEASATPASVGRAAARCPSSARSCSRSSAAGAPGRCSARSRSSRSSSASRSASPGPRRADAGRRSSARSRTTGSSSGVTALIVAIPLFLPLTIGVVAGDTIAGEASHGTLRYLLIAPAGRIRLLLVKYVARGRVLRGATLTVVVVGTLVGWVLFPIGPVTLLSGATVERRRGARCGSSRSPPTSRSRCSGCRRSGSSSRRSRPCPSGRWRPRRSSRWSSQIIDALPQLEWLHPWLFTHYWLGFADLLREPIVWDSFVDNAAAAGGLHRGVRRARDRPVPHQGRAVVTGCRELTASAEDVLANARRSPKLGGIAQ